MGKQVQSTLHKQTALISALLIHTAVSKAADVAGISRSTASKWLKDPDFQTRLAKAREQGLKKFVDKLHRCSGDMLDVLVKIAKDKAQPVEMRVKCAKAVVELAMKTADEKFMSRVKRWSLVVGDHDGPPAPAAEPPKSEPEKKDELDGMTRAELELIARPTKPEAGGADNATAH